MPTELPSTPDFTAELESVLRREATRRKRARRPFTSGALRRLRALSNGAGHVGAAVALSATLLILAPGTLNRELELPPISEPPAAGYLAQFGARPASATATITLAREAGFEVEVITTFVADRASHGTVVQMRHMSSEVPSVPMNEPVRGPLLIIIGLTVGDAAGATAE
ncbi:MAG: hypothetical protein R3246_03920 [Acidimicrobiia bacterium]|nr:hypothetical protein [Acidimicrobiia bacterium]